MKVGLTELLEFLPSLRSIFGDNTIEEDYPITVRNSKYSESPVAIQILNRLLLAFIGVSIVFVVIYYTVKRFITDKYLVFEEVSSDSTTPRSNLFSKSNPHSGKDTLSPLRAHRDFYQNLNNSSQYLRRDSFSQ